MVLLFAHLTSRLTSIFSCTLYHTFTHMQGRNKERKRRVVGQECQKKGERKKGKKGGAIRETRQKKRIEKDEVLADTLFQC